MDGCSPAESILTLWRREKARCGYRSKKESAVLRSSIRIHRPTVLVDSLCGTHRPLFRQCRVHSSKDIDDETRNRQLIVQYTKFNCLMVAE